MILKPRVDEVAVLAQVSDVDELRAAPFSCFTEIAPFREGRIADLFPGASSRHGGQAAAPAWWTDTRIDVRVQHLFKVRDAVVFPRWGVVVTGAGEVMRLTVEEAAYASPDLSGLPHVRLTPEGPVLDLPQGMERRGRAAVALPAGMANYGHFLLDGLTGATALADCGLLDDFPLVVPPLEPWQRRHLDLLGVAASDSGAEAIRVDEVVYTSAIHHFLHTPNTIYRRLREIQVARAAPRPGGDGPRAPRLLYLSRGSANTRVMAGEAALRRRLAAIGFRVVEPATLSVDAQVALFAGADVVLGSAGAAFANVLYCRPGTVVIEIQPHGMENHWVQRLCIVNGLAGATWFCPAAAPNPRHPERGLRYDLDLEAFLDFVRDVLDQNRIARKAPRPGRMGRVAGRLAGLFRP